MADHTSVKRMVAGVLVVAGILAAAGFVVRPSGPSVEVTAGSLAAPVAEEAAPDLAGMPSRQVAGGRVATSPELEAAADLASAELVGHFLYTSPAGSTVPTQVVIANGLGVNGGMVCVFEVAPTQLRVAGGGFGSACFTGSRDALEAGPIQLEVVTRPDNTRGGTLILPRGVTTASIGGRVLRMNGRVVAFAGRADVPTTIEFGAGSTSRAQSYTVRATPFEPVPVP